MKIAYFDAFSGISGDMTLGAFLQLGVSLDALRHELSGLKLSGYRLRQTIRQRSGIQATKFEVEVHEPQVERSARSIADMLRASALIPQVKETALRIFQVLARAEGHIHGVPPEDVHFHEVGAVDSIVDIIGTAFCLHTLGVERVYVSPLPLGSGVVSSRHGILPVPGPATLELLKGFPVCVADGQSELVTPTGAAILAAVAQPGSVPPCTRRGRRLWGGRAGAERPSESAAGDHRPQPRAAPDRPTPGLGNKYRRSQPRVL